MGNSSGMITAAIGGVIAVIIALVVYPILQSAADTYYLEYAGHCEVGSETFLRVYRAGATSGDITGSALGTVTQDGSLSSCSVAFTADDANAGEIRSEHGVKVGTAVVDTGNQQTGTPATQGFKNTASATARVAGAGGTNIDAWASASVWVTPSAILSVYSGISTLVLSILPIVSVVGFLGVSANNIYSYVKGGAGAIQMVVVRSISGLIITIVGIYLAPTIMDFANDVYLVSTDGRYGIMAQFGTIIKLVLGFFPVVYNAGLLAMFGLADQALKIGDRKMAGSSMEM